MNEHTRTRIAEIIYNNGDSTAWTKALHLADLIMWELGSFIEETAE